MTRAHMADALKGSEMDGKLPDVTFYAKKERRYEDTCWYTLSLVTALICCVPCGVVGLMNAMLAKQEAMRDNEAGYRNRVRNAKLCTVMAVVFGVVVIASVTMFCFLLTSSILEGNGYRSRIMSIRESSGRGTTQNILEELTYLNRTINSH